MNAIQYIPSGTEIVLFQNGQHVWYTTKQDIPVNGSVTAAMCPVREIEVATTSYKGFTIWFMESQIVFKLSAEQELAAKNLQLVKIDYDIPTRVRLSGRVVDPYTYMWRYGVRTSESCWVIPSASMQALAVRLRELTRTGCTWHPTPIDSAASADIIQRAIASLQGELVQARINAENRRRTAEERFNDAGNGDVDSRAKKRQYTLTAIATELKKKTENVIQAAKALGIPLQWVEQTAIRSAVRGLAAGYTAQVEQTCDVIDAAKNVGTAEGKEVAKQVASGEMPTDIASDYLKDAGVMNDDGTFSLVDDETE